VTHVAEALALVERVRATGLLEPGAPVVVLLSGGRDSVCLLAVACEICGPEAVSALHVDYGLRPESEGDREFCVALCERLGVELEAHRAERAPEETGNLQAWARDLRYGHAVRAAERRGARIAVGHTLTDQAETVLYRLAASPGRRALLGMPASSGLLVRPLLAAGVTREETAAWCTQRGLAWREDRSNDSDVYARARVRHELVPALRAVHPAAEANVLATSELLREEAEVLDVVVESALAGRDRIALEHLAKLPRALARLVVRRLAEDATGALCARAAARLEDLLALDPAGAALDVGDGARAVVEAGVVRFERTPPLPGLHSAPP
jgi:tRNA(Ile)-lysidine synthase